MRLYVTIKPPQVIVSSFDTLDAETSGTLSFVLKLIHSYMKEGIFDLYPVILAWVMVSYLNRGASCLAVQHNEGHKFHTECWLFQIPRMGSWNVFNWWVPS